MTRTRRLGIAFLVAALLAAAAVGCAKLYLASGRATQQVRDRLQNVLGVPVEVADADIGLAGQSSLQGLKIYEPGEKPPEQPWLLADDIEADVSVVGLLGGAMPQRVRVKGATVDLRFDKGGHLLTKLPSTHGTGGVMPEIVLDGGKLTLAQEGRPPMVINGVQGTVTSGPEGFTVKGTVSDPYWGDWNAGGTFRPAESALHLVLDTPRVAVTTDKLKALAFVPAKVWREVIAEGTTPVRLGLDFKTDTPGVHYKVELEPTETTVRVPSIDLDADHALGKVVVEDELVLLRDVKGRVKGRRGEGRGAIETSGNLDFRPAASVLSFTVAVRDVPLHDLPEEWGLPESLDGQLSGQAKLKVVLADRVHTDGAGEGEVRDVTFFGQRQAAPIRFALRPAEGGKFRFQQQPAVGAVLPGALPAAVVLAQAPPPPAATDAGGLPTPGRALELVPRAAGWLAGKVTGAATAVLRRARDLDQPPPPGQAPTYFEADLSLQDVNLGELVRRLDLQLPFPVEGTLSFKLHVAFPVDTPKDLKAYRFDGTSDLPRLNLAGFDMTDVHARVRYAGGLLVLEDLRGRTPVPRRPGRPEEAPGTFDGSAHLQVSPPGDLTATVSTNGVPVDVALDRLPGAAGLADGRVSGTVRVRAPAARLKDPSTWEGSGVVRSDHAQAYGLTFRDASANLGLARGTAALRDFRGELEGAPLTGSAEAVLSGAYPFKGHADLEKADLAMLQRLRPELRPPVAVAGSFGVTADFQGTLAPASVTASGTARGRDLTVEGARVNDVSFHWASTADLLRLTDLAAKLYGGEVNGTAAVPLKESATGGADLRVADVDAKALTQGIPAFPVRLEGQVSGTVKGTLSAAAPGKPREANADVELTAPRLKLQGIPTERVRGTVAYRGGSGSYRLEGGLAGGTFKVEGPFAPRRAPASSEAPAPRPAPAPGGAEEQQPPPPQGSLEVRGVRLGRLLEEMFPRRGYSALSGVLDLSLPFRLEGPDRQPAGRGTFTISRLRYDDVTLADRLQGAVDLTREGIRFGDIGGSLYGGTVRAVAGVRFGRGQRNFLSLDLTSVEVSQLLAPFPRLAGLAEGPVNVRLRAGGVGEYSGTAEVTFLRGRLFGVQVGELRLPIDFSFVPGDGGRLEVRDTSGQVAMGRALARAGLSWGGVTRLEGSVRFFDAEVRALFGRSGEFGTSYFGSGRLNGRLDFGAADLRSVNDLTATLTGTLTQTQASGIPVLQQVMPFIPIVGGSSTQFQSGDVRGRLAGGVFRLQRLALNSSAADILVEGNITLEGRLDLEVTARTGGPVLNARGLQLLGLRLPAVGPLPLTLIVDASAFLANRVIHLRVTGTVRNPVIRVEPVPLLTEEAVRFFLNRANLPIASIPPLP
jgi:translocation and assembly module TamB